MHNKNRACCIADGSFRNAAHEQTLQALTAMRSHYNKINIVFLCESINCLIGLTLLDHNINIDSGLFAFLYNCCKFLFSLTDKFFNCPGSKSKIFIICIDY